MLIRLCVKKNSKEPNLINSPLKEEIFKMPVDYLLYYKLQRNTRVRVEEQYKIEQQIHMLTYKSVSFSGS